MAKAIVILQSLYSVIREISKKCQLFKEMIAGKERSKSVLYKINSYLGRLNNFRLKNLKEN